MKESLGGRLAVLALVFLAFGGYVKGLPHVGALAGIDTTLLAAVVIAGVVYVSLLDTHRVLWNGVVGVLGLGLTFVPGVLSADSGSYSQHKTHLELPLVVLCMMGGALVLRADWARRWWLWGVAILGCIVAMLATLYPDVALAQASGTLAVAGSNTIGLGRATGAAVVVTASVAVMTRQRRLVLLAVAALIAVNMLRSGSRGPVLAALVAIVVVAALTPGRRRDVRVLLTAVAVAAASWLAFSADLVVGRLTTFQDTSAEERRFLWRQDWTLLGHHWAGVGWGRQVDYLAPWAMLPGTGDDQYPHNLLLEVGVEGGWLALVGLLVVIVVAFRRQLRSAGSPVEAAMLGLFVFYLLNAMVSGDINDNRGLWVALGAALATQPILGSRPRSTRAASTPSQSGSSMYAPTDLS